MDSLSPNEADVLTVFLGWLNEQSQSTYQIEFRPDQDPGRGSDPACDYVCVNESGIRVAVEVTTFWRGPGAGDEDRAWTDGRTAVLVIDAMQCVLSRWDESGSCIEVYRRAPDDLEGVVGSELVRIVDKKRQQLEKWSAERVPTYLVAYHTAWTLLNNVMLRRIAAKTFMHGQGVVGNLVIVCGNPPGDAWCHAFQAPV